MMISPHFCSQPYGDFTQAVRLVDCDAIKVIDNEEWDRKSNLIGTLIYGVDLWSPGIEPIVRAIALILVNDPIVYMNIPAFELEKEALIVWMKKLPASPAA